MGKPSPKLLQLQSKIQLKRAASAEKLLATKNQAYQRVLDQFCLKLDAFLFLFQDKLTVQVRELLLKATMNGVLPVVHANGLERRRSYVDFDAALQNYIRYCSDRAPLNFFANIFDPVPQAVPVNPFVPVIRQALYDSTEAYRNLDRLYHLAFTQDLENQPENRVAALMNAIKQLPVKIDEVGQLVGELLFILNGDKKAAELLQTQGLYARHENGVKPDKSIKRANRPVRL